MIKKINDLLSGITATVIGGIFLVISFILSRTEISLPVDPAWITVIISGVPLLYLAVWRIIYNPGISKISSALLITVAMIAAIIIDDLFAAGEVAFIMAIGAILEDMTTNRAKKGLSKLINLAPTEGRRISDGKEEMVKAADIKKGDVIRILPGETIPADGKVISGETSVDQSVMTGESLPVDKSKGDEVYSGTINRFGAIDISVTRSGQDSSLQRLIKLVEEAENRKAPMARTADRAASWLVPAALIIAIAAGIITKDIVRAVTVLVVFCPCALVLATPTAIMAAIGQATKHGVIVKSGEALEKMGKVNTVTFDKTGTLTYGRLEVSDIISFDQSVNEEGILILAASAESKSEHPLGKAIVSCANERGLLICDCDDFSMQAGKGIKASVNGRNVICGNEQFLSENGIKTAAEKQKAECYTMQGKALVYVAESGKCIGAVTLADKIRPETAKVIAEMKGMGADSVLLTGDNKRTAEYFAEKSGITEVYSELLPENKQQIIIKLQSENRTVCMIGDGVNDAPALKTADVGVAMGSMGSDIAVEAADIALMSDDITKIPYLKRLSDATVGTIKASITLSMCINLVAVVLSVAGILNPTTGALVHNAGSCFVILIAALLYDRKFDKTSKNQ